MTDSCISPSHIEWVAFWLRGILFFPNADRQLCSNSLKDLDLLPTAWPCRCVVFYMFALLLLRCCRSVH